MRARGDAKDVKLDTIKLPPGFTISVYAEVPGARSMTMGPGGTLFVGTRDGSVYAVVDAGDGTKAKEVVTLAKDLNEPNGVAVRDGALYVAEVSRILRFDGIEARLKSPGRPVVVTDKLPRDGHHGWKFIAFGPDGFLYVPVGAPCNICKRSDPYAAISRMRPDGTAFEVFARGVRNTVGFDWDPATKELWFTDNGRDWMDDDTPPDELNHAPAAGMHFGYPWCHGGDVKDPEFGNERPCSEFVRPAVRFQAHVAALGMRFYTGTAFPPEYTGTDLRRAARLVEPQEEGRVPRRDRAHQGRKGRPRGRLRGGLAPGREGLGTARGRFRASGRLASRVRRQGRSRLPDRLLALKAAGPRYDRDARGVKETSMKPARPARRGSA